jgi:hypothetical protein
MPNPTNLTEGLAHLRGKKSVKVMVGQSDHKTTPKRSGETIGARERMMATDYFSLFIYTVLGVAGFSQLLLIVWFGGR